MSYVLYLPMDEGSGTTTYDQSGLNNSGSLLPAGSEPAWVDGKYGKALSFDGTNDYVDCGTGVRPSSAISISCWIKTTIFDTYNQSFIFNAAIDSSLVRNWGLQIADNGRVRFDLWHSNGSTISAYSDNSISSLSGQWIHIVGVYGGTANSLIVYVNGAANTPYGDAGDIKSLTLNLRVGAWTDYGRYFSGSIDEVRIYSRAITQEEITELYNNNLSINFNDEQLTVLPKLGGVMDQLSIIKPRFTGYYDDLLMALPRFTQYLDEFVKMNPRYAGYADEIYKMLPQFPSYSDELMATLPKFSQFINELIIFLPRFMQYNDALFKTNPRLMEQIEKLINVLPRMQDYSDGIINVLPKLLLHNDESIAVLPKLLSYGDKLLVLLPKFQSYADELLRAQPRFASYGVNLYKILSTLQNYSDGLTKTLPRFTTFSDAHISALPALMKYGESFIKIWAGRRRIWLEITDGQTAWLQSLGTDSLWLSSVGEEIYIE